MARDVLGCKQPNQSCMKMNFDSRGNLYQTVELTFKQFRKAFGINAGRLNKIDTAITFFKIFSSCGCKTVYIGGSFASTKENPADIDLCFDITPVDLEKLKKKFPEFFDFNKIGEIRKHKACHILFCDTKTTYLLEMLEADRDGNSKGLVKLRLKEGDDYD